VDNPERIEANKKLLLATQRLLDLKSEKKTYNKEINDQIHETEAEIKELAKEV
jgi:HAMP domain-containing protein